MINRTLTLGTFALLVWPTCALGQSAPANSDWFEMAQFRSQVASFHQTYDVSADYVGTDDELPWNSLLVQHLPQGLGPTTTSQGIRLSRSEGGIAIRSIGRVQAVGSEVWSGNYSLGSLWVNVGGPSHPKAVALLLNMKYSVALNGFPPPFVKYKLSLAVTRTIAGVGGSKFTVPISFDYTNQESTNGNESVAYLPLTSFEGAPTSYRIDYRLGLVRSCELGALPPCDGPPPDTHTAMDYSVSITLIESPTYIEPAVPVAWHTYTIEEAGEQDASLSIAPASPSTLAATVSAPEGADVYLLIGNGLGPSRSIPAGSFPVLVSDILKVLGPVSATRNSSGLSLASFELGVPARPQQALVSVQAVSHNDGAVSSSQAVSIGSHDL